MKRFWALPAGEKRLLLIAFVALPLLTLSVKQLGYGRTRAWLTGGGKIPPARTHRQERGERALATARIVAWAGAYGVVGGNCLSRSLLLWWLLRNQGFSAAVRFGARKRDGVFEAHAWVEDQEIVLNPAVSNGTDFRPIEPVESRSARDPDGRHSSPPGAETPS